MRSINTRDDAHRHLVHPRRAQPRARHAGAARRLAAPGQLRRVPRVQPHAARRAVHRVHRRCRASAPRRSACRRRRRRQRSASCTWARCARPRTAGFSQDPRPAATISASPSRARTRRATGSGAGAARRNSPPSRSTATPRQLEAVLSLRRQDVPGAGRLLRQLVHQPQQPGRHRDINAAGVPTRSSSACRSTTRRTSCSSTAATTSRERTRATFKVAYTRATQDEQIPVGPGVPTFAGAPTPPRRPARHHAAAGRASPQRATNEFSWLASLRYYESDEKTPQERVVQTAAGLRHLRRQHAAPLQDPDRQARRHLPHGAGPERDSAASSTPSRSATCPSATSTPPASTTQRYVPWRTEVDETTFRARAAPLARGDAERPRRATRTASATARSSHAQPTSRSPT